MKLWLPLRCRFPWSRRRAREADLDRELRDHLDLEAEEQRQAGVSDEEAGYAARRALGNAAQIKEDVRMAWGLQWLETLGQDLRYGLRQLRRNPGFTAVAVLTLALGIGANTAIFSMVNAILLQPLPYSNPQKLVRLEITEPGHTGLVPVASGPDFKDWQKENHVFEEMAAGFDANKSLTGGSEPMQLSGFEVSPQIFHLLGIAPLMGRAFTQDETQHGHNQVVILSYGLWQRAFGGDKAIVGKAIALDGEVYDVAGVMPQSLKFPDLWWGIKAEFWIPLNLEQPAWRRTRGSHWLWVLGRMKEGVHLAQAQADMATISRNLQRQYPRDDAGVNAKVLGLHGLVTKQVRPALLVLFAAVGFLLLIACANIANLLLARGIARGREMAVRMAVGSGRVRLIRQLITESVLLFLLGGIAGLLVGWGALRILLYAAPQGYIPGIIDVRLGGWVFAFTFGVAFLTGLLAGIAPAIQSSKPGLRGTLKEGARTAAAAHRGSRNILTVAEIALALLMLIGAGLAIKSLVRLMGVQPGFDPHNVLKANLALPKARYKSNQQVSAFYERLLDRLRALPGVESASAAAYLPLQGNPSSSVYIEGQPLPKNVYSSPEVEWCQALPGYFRTMRIPLLRGRDFTLLDTPKSPQVAIINEAMARLFWPNQNPIGKRFSKAYQKPQWITVVGVVGDVLEVGLDEPALPEAYFPETQDTDPWLAVVLRTSTPPLNEAGLLRHAVRSLDPELPVYGVGTLSRIVSQSSEQQRFVALLLGLFAAAALALALIGIYGVISYSVAQRTHEFGIRLALGARREDVLRLVAREGWALALIGVAAGLVAAFALTRLMASLLYDVKPNDPATFVALPLLLIAAALAACLIPARRAANVDPMVALRHE
ncbi:MAG: ABC transporter permease [Acidobacteriota bacterium]|nr:ABC transporter permease [Acidobacteriota bacterium]